VGETTETGPQRHLRALRMARICPKMWQRPLSWGVGQSASGSPYEVSGANQVRLGPIVADWNIPQKHVRRVRVVLLTEEDLGTSGIMRRTGTTFGDPPDEATRWTAATMAKAVGISVSSVQRIWRAQDCSRTGCTSSNCRVTPSWCQSCGISSASMSIRQRMRSCSVSTRSRRSRRLIARSSVCHRNPVAAAR
jgi:hypothetical protein